MRRNRISGAMAPAVLSGRKTTYWFFGVGRLTVLWDTRQAWPDRKAGDL